MSAQKRRPVTYEPESCRIWDGPAYARDLARRVREVAESVRGAARPRRPEKSPKK